MSHAALSLNAMQCIASDFLPPPIWPHPVYFSSKAALTDPNPRASNGQPTAEIISPPDICFSIRYSSVHSIHYGVAVPKNKLPCKKKIWEKKDFWKSNQLIKKV